MHGQTSGMYGICWRRRWVAQPARLRLPVLMCMGIVQLDPLLQLFEYQDTRRHFLTLLSQQHALTHGEHHYKDRSSEPDGPTELDALHEHGHRDEMGGPDTDDTDARTPKQRRLAFHEDVQRRLRHLNSATGSYERASP